MAVVKTYHLPAATHAGESSIVSGEPPETKTETETGSGPSAQTGHRVSQEINNAALPFVSGPSSSTAGPGHPAQTGPDQSLTELLGSVGRLDNPGFTLAPLTLPTPGGVADVDKPLPQPPQGLVDGAQKFVGVVDGPMGPLRSGNTLTGVVINGVGGNGPIPNIGGVQSGVDGVGDLAGLYKGATSAYEALKTKNDPNATAAERYQADQALNTRQGVDNFIKAGDFATQMTNLGAPGTAAVPILGTIVSGAMATKAGIAANEAKNYRNNLDGVLTRLQDPSKERVTDHQDLVNTAQYAHSQMGKRYNNQSIRAAGATTSAVGGVVTAVSPLAGPAAPAVAVAGAALGAAGGVMTTGVSVNQGLHYVQKELAGTRGEERGRQANNLCNLLNSQDSATRKYAEDIVTSIGLDPNIVRSDPTKGWEILFKQLSSS